MKLSKIPNKVDGDWLLDKLRSVSTKKLSQRSEAGQIARKSAGRQQQDSYLRGGEISGKLMGALQEVNGEQGGELTLKDADGNLTAAGEIFVDLYKKGRAGREVFFEAPEKGAVLYANFSGVNMDRFRWNDPSGEPITVTGRPNAEFTLHWAQSTPDEYYVEPTYQYGVLYHEKSGNVDLVRSGNMSVSDWNASFKTELEQDGVKAADIPETIKAKQDNRDPSTVRRELSADFFQNALKVPVQRVAPMKWFVDGWRYMGLRDFVEPLDKDMWKAANPDRKVPKNVWIFKCQWQGGVQARGEGTLTKADLKYRPGHDGDGADQYRAKGKEQTYGLKTGKKKSGEAYGHLADFIRTLNGVGLKDDRGNAIPDNDPKRFNTEAYKQAMTESCDVYEMLRAYAGLVLTGAWDNLINPSNFSWVAEKDKNDKVTWRALPIDLDSTWGIRWPGQMKWQDLDILCREGPVENVPVIWKNLLQNDHFKAYVLDFMEHLMNTEFTPDAVGKKAGQFWEHNKAAAFQEGKYDEMPFTGRPFTNSEVWGQNEDNWTIKKDSGLYAPSIRNFVDWRRGSAQHQLQEIRRHFQERSGVDFAGGKLEP